VASLHIVVAVVSTCTPWGGACSRTFLFFLFSVVREPIKGVQMRREVVYFFLLFYVWHLLLTLAREVRDKRGAESALESCEELQKEVKWSLFVRSALFSLVV